MKTLLLATLLLSSSAFAEPKVLQSIQVDLDADGKPDTVENINLDPGADFNRLQVTLSKSGTTQIFDKLVPNKTNDKTCNERGHNAFSAGPNHTFLWLNTSSDFDECQHEDQTTMRIGLNGTDLRVEHFHDYSFQWHMGDASPSENDVVDFLAGTVKVDMAEGHGYHKPILLSEKLRQGCNATLRDVEANNGLPMCVAQQVYFMGQELLGKIDPDLISDLSVCPELRGTYACKIGEYSQDMLSIHRIQESTNVYDISTENRVLFADGKIRKVNLFNLSNDKNRTFQKVSCRRELLRLGQVHYLALDKGDKRKPLFDRLPWSREVSTWTQLDTTGDHFIYKKTTQYLKDDGTYRDTDPTIEDCVRK